MSIAANLRRVMDEQGVSVASLAGQIGAEPSSVRKYLSGKIRPSDAVLARISGVLGVETEDIKYGPKSGRTSGKLTTAEVARVTGIDPLSLRIGLQRGIYPFGTAYKRMGSNRFTYVYFSGEVGRWAADRKALGGGMNETSDQRFSTARD